MFKKLWKWLLEFLHRDPAIVTGWGEDHLYYKDYLIYLDTKCLYNLCFRYFFICIAIYKGHKPILHYNFRVNELSKSKIVMGDLLKEYIEKEGVRKLIKKLKKTDSWSIYKDEGELLFLLFEGGIDV